MAACEVSSGSIGPHFTRIEPHHTALLHFQGGGISEAVVFRTIFFDHPRRCRRRTKIWAMSCDAVRGVAGAGTGSGPVVLELAASFDTKDCKVEESSQVRYYLLPGYVCLDVVQIEQPLHLLLSFPAHTIPCRCFSTIKATQTKRVSEIKERLQHLSARISFEA